MAAAQVAEHHALGNRDLLASPKLALFCSRRCPGKLVLRTYDLVIALRSAPLTLVGGFHSPMEQECLRLILRGPGRAILCLARGLDGMRLKPDWREPLAQGRLLILSPFPGHQRRVTGERARRRNAFVANLADTLFVAHAAPGGETEHLALSALAAGKAVLTFDAPENAHLVTRGAQPIAQASTLIAMCGIEPSPPQQGLVLSLPDGTTYSTMSSER